MVISRTGGLCVKAAFFVTMATVVIGCGSRGGSPPDKEAIGGTTTGTLAVTATVSGTAGAETPPLLSGDPAAEGPKEVPTFVLERFKTATFNPDKVYAIDGALVVVSERFRGPPEGITLGRVVGDTIDPFGGPINNMSATGGNEVTHVGGYYPDGVDVYTRSSGGRIAGPGITPATGKGESYGFGGAGGGALIAGVARVGETSILAGWEQFTGLWALLPYRGPPRKLVRQTPAQAGCSGVSTEDLGMWFGRLSPFALDPRVFSATRAGTILSIGRLCRHEGRPDDAPGAEIWTGNDEKSRIEELTSVMDPHDYYWWERAFPGKGDEMWYGAEEGEYNSTMALLHYKDGHFEKVEPPAKHIVNIAGDPVGAVYINDGETIFRRDEGKWTPIAHLDWPQKFDTFAVYEGALWASSSGQVFRLKPGKGVEPRDDCPSPFVHIQDVKPERADKERYPNTAAAIATFPEAADLTFLAFTVADRPRIGVSVKSNSQGKALIEHLRPLLTDISPRLVCYAPEKPRKIPFPAAKKSGGGQ